MKFFSLVILILVFSSPLFSQENIHEVKPKETLYGISKQYGVSIETLKKYNPFLQERDLQVGDRLNLGSNKQASQPKSGFIIVEVAPKQTLYSLSKQYNISQEDIIKNNPTITSQGLKIGDKIKIPAKNTVVARESQENTSPKTPSPAAHGNAKYEVKQGDTLYAISDKLGVTVDQLYAANENLRTEGLKPGQTLRIPKVNKINNIGEGYVTHRVQAGETMFSLVNYYHLTLDQFVSANPEIKSGLKEGMEVKIPISGTVSVPKAAKNVNRVKDDTISLVMLLPFNLDQKESKERPIARDFLLGSKLAMQRLAKEGKRIKLKVIDSSGGQQEIITQMDSIDMSRVDAIIGPFHELSLNGLGNHLKATKIPLVSPVISSETLAQTPNMIIAKPSIDDQINALLEDVHQNYKGERIVIVADAKGMASAEKIKTALQQKYKQTQVDLITSPGQLTQNEIKIDPATVKTDSLAVAKEKLLVIVVTEDNDLGKNTLEKIKTLDYTQINAYGLGNIPYYNAFVKNNRQNLQYLMDLKFKFVTDEFVNEYGENEKSILKDFSKYYCCVPTKYMISGYEVIYDIIDRMNPDGELIDMKTEKLRLYTNFKYKKSKDNTYINEGVRFIRF